MTSAVVKSDLLQILMLNLGSQSADIVLPGPKPTKNMRLVKARLIDQAGVAADNTNKVKVQLKKGSTVIAEIYTQAADEGALTANVAKDFPETDLYIEAGSQLTVNVDVSGSGALTLAQLQLEWHPA